MKALHFQHFETGRRFQARVELVPPPFITQTGTHRYTIHIQSACTGTHRYTIHIQSACTSVHTGTLYIYSQLAPLPHRYTHVHYHRYTIHMASIRLAEPDGTTRVLRSVSHGQNQSHLTDRMRFVVRPGNNLESPPATGPGLYRKHCYNSEAFARLAHFPHGVVRRL